MSLLMAVANEEPRAPHQVDRTIPRGLSRAIQRCLAKKPEGRFGSLAALASALQDYSSSASPAASPVRRIVATVIDHVILFSPLVWIVGISQPSDIDSVRTVAIFAVGGWAWRVAYFALLEGIWGASIGKACAGIRVVGPDGRPAGLVRATCRSALFVFAFAASESIDLIMMAIAPEALLTWAGSAFGFLRRGEMRLAVSLAALFCTARRGNRFAGVHDLVTNTRVVERRPLTRPATAPAVVDAGPRAAIARVGPYDVVGSVDRWHAAGVEPWLRPGPGAPGLDLLRVRRRASRFRRSTRREQTDAPPMAGRPPDGWRCLGCVFRGSRASAAGCVPHLRAPGPTCAGGCGPSRGSVRPPRGNRHFHACASIVCASSTAVWPTSSTTRLMTRRSTHTTPARPRPRATSCHASRHSRSAADSVRTHCRLAPDASCERSMARPLSMQATSSRRSSSS